MNMYINGKKIALINDNSVFRYGENLLSGSNFKDLETIKAAGWTSPSPSCVTVQNNTVFLDCINGTGPVDFQCIVSNLSPNMQYTLSVQVMSGKGTMYILPRTIDLNKTENYYDNAFYLNRVGIRSINQSHVTGSDTSKAIVLFRAWPGNKLAFRLPKLEYGTQATIWTPSPTDF